ncbi:MAG: hypothetical protein RL264_2819 [Bacteroidota bacterium]|jgi:hypothetical protein
MNQKAENIKSDIINQLKLDGLISTGFVRVFAGSVTKNTLESVTIELTIYKYFEAEVKVFLDDQKQVNIQYRGINGVIGTDDMIKLSTSLNNSKGKLAQHFN